MQYIQDFHCCHDKEISDLPWFFSWTNTWFSWPKADIFLFSMSLQEKLLSFMILQEKQFPSFIVLTVTPACFYSLWFVGDFAGETCLFPSFLILQVKPALLYSLGFCSWNLPGYRLLDFANETCLFLSFMILQVKSAWLYSLGFCRWNLPGYRLLDVAGETCLFLSFRSLQEKPVSILYCF